VLWIRIVVNADPDPCSYGFLSDYTYIQRWIFNWKIYYTIGDTGYLRRYKSLYDRLKIRFIVNFGQFPCSWIRIRFPKRIWIQKSQTNADPDPQHCCKYLQFFIFGLLKVMGSQTCLAEFLPITAKIPRVENAELNRLNSLHMLPKLGHLHSFCLQIQYTTIIWIRNSISKQFYFLQK
jgi:hypothetical protein